MDEIIEKGFAVNGDITDPDNPLQLRARKLGAWIGPSPVPIDMAKANFGPFALYCSDRYHLAWGGGEEATGLPIEGIVDALDCCERGDQLEAQGKDYKEAWANFGSSWAYKYHQSEAAQSQS